ncbi:hypothetical protein ACWEQG_12210 [Microbispora sp. NPDC004025]
MPDPAADAMALVTAWAGRSLTFLTIKGGFSHHVGPDSTIPPRSPTRSPNPYATEDPCFGRPIDKIGGWIPRTS